MIRILEVCTASSPAYALVFARAQALNQQHAGQLQIDLLCSDGPEVDLMRNRGMQVLVTDLHRSLNPLRLLQSGLNLHRVLRRHDYDVVHLHFGVPSLVGRILALFMRRPVWIYQSHGYSIADNTSLPGKWAYLLVERLLKSTVHLALFQSREDMDLAYTYHLLDSQQMIYLGNGIDTDRFSPGSAAAKTDGKTVFGMVARFEPIKNHRLLLDAIKHLRLQTPNFKVYLIGQGELQTEIAAHIAAHELEPWVEILPYSNDMPSFYQQIDVGVLTSFGGGLPRALLEPMACAKPVLCTDVKGSREAVLDRQTGFVLPLGNPKALAEKMRWLIENPAERERMGYAARTHVVRNFSAQQVLERLGKIYLACTDQATLRQTNLRAGLEGST